MKAWQCSCGHIIYRENVPAPVTWTDGHTCTFREVPGELEIVTQENFLSVARKHDLIKMDAEEKGIYNSFFYFMEQLRINSSIWLEKEEIKECVDEGISQINRWIKSGKILPMFS